MTETATEEVQQEAVTGQKEFPIKPEVTKIINDFWGQFQDAIKVVQTKQTNFLEFVEYAKKDANIPADVKVALGEGAVKFIVVPEPSRIILPENGGKVTLA